MSGVARFSKDGWEGKVTDKHECEPPKDGMIQHRWACKKCKRVWEVVDFEESNGNSIYEPVDGEAE